MIKIELSLRNLLAIAGALVGLWLLVRLWPVVLLAAVGLLLAAALMPYVEWLSRRTHNRGAAVLIVVLVVLGAVSLILLLVMPPMIAQGRDLWERAPELRDSAARFADERGWTELRDRIREFEPADVLQSTDLVATSRTVLGAVLSLFTVCFIAAYILLDARRIEQFLYFSTPHAWHRHIGHLLPALQRVVGGYIRGQAITSASIFVFSAVLLTALRVPNAIALAAIAAVADLIPMVGVYILLTPMILAALTVSTTVAIIVTGAMVAYQQFEDRVLVPRVYGQTLRLPAVVVVLALLAGAELLGLVGALLSLPVAAGIRVIIEYFAGLRDAHAHAEEVRSKAPEAGPSGDPFAPDRPRRIRPARSSRP